MLCEFALWQKIVFHLSRIQLLLILSLFFLGCQSPAPRPSSANPYHLKMWARCRPVSGPATEVDFYVWNRSTPPLSIDMAALFTNPLLPPRHEVNVNFKGTQGVQSFRTISDKSTKPEDLLFELRPNEAVDLTYDSDVTFGKDLILSWKLKDPQNNSYEVTLPCRN